MKIKQWALAMLLSVFYFQADAQSLHFPVSGTYEVENEAGSRAKDFDQVDIGTNTFSLLNNGQEVRTYRIVSAMKGGFSVEQIVSGNAYKETFNVTIDQMSPQDCYFTVHYEEGSEKIHLRKR